MSTRCWDAGEISIHSSLSIANYLPPALWKQPQLKLNISPLREMFAWHSVTVCSNRCQFDVKVKRQLLFFRYQARSGEGGRHEAQLSLVQFQPQSEYWNQESINYRLVFLFVV